MTITATTRVGAGSVPAPVRTLPINLSYSIPGQGLTQRFEGCRLEAYQDSVMVWTIGYGHTRGVKSGDTCTKAQALQWLIEDFAQAVADVRTHVTIPLAQYEFDALVDFAFNLGCDSLNKSTLLSLVNHDQLPLAAQEFPKWDHAGGQVVAGLLRRRLAEQAEFLGQDSNENTSTTVA